MKNRSSIAVKNITSNLLFQFVTIISGFIMPKLLIGNYGSDVYGLVASITQFLSLITLLEAGIGPVIKVKLYKYIANNEKDKIQGTLKNASKFFKKIGYIFLVYILILCLLYPYLNNEFSYLFTITLIIIIAISILSEYFIGVVYNLYLQAAQRYYITSYVQIISYIINIFLVVFLVKIGCSIIVVKIANTLVFIARPLFQYFYVRKKIGIDVKNAKKEYNIENKFDGLSQHVSYVIYTNTDVTILTIFSNLAMVAVYSVYNLIATAVKSVVSAFANGMDSIFGDMYAKNEQEVLNRSFSIYEFVYYTISTIIYLATIALIVPFINIYTNGITDANYNQPIFGILLVLAGFVNCCRTMYSSLVYSAGHFKQTNIVSWLEAILNILISSILIFRIGLVGVAIGTLISSLVRLIYFLYYSSKIILKRRSVSWLKWISAIIFELLITILLMKLGPLNYMPNNYLSWTLYAIITTMILSFVVMVINILFNYPSFKTVIDFIKEKIKSRRSKNA